MASFVEAEAKAGIDGIRCECHLGLSLLCRVGCSWYRITL